MKASIGRRKRVKGSPGDRVFDAVKAYDDVLELNWKVWGSQWNFPLPDLVASFRDPALDPNDPAYQVWAAVIVLAVIGVAGVAYLLVARPQRKLVGR